MNPKPIVDLRIYTGRQRAMPEFLRIAEKLGMPVQLRHVGAPLAYYVTDIGPQEEVMHLWGFDNLADMEARRAARNKDPDWQTYIDATDGLIVKQQCRVVRRVPLPVMDKLTAAAAEKPLVDFRTLTIQRSRMSEFLQIFETMALPVQLRHGGPPIALYTSEIGPLNELIQLWGYDSLADMEALQASRHHDPAWQQYLLASGPLIVSEDSRAIRRVLFTNQASRQA